jgi:hypothetical protein
MDCYLSLQDRIALELCTILRHVQLTVQPYSRLRWSGLMFQGWEWTDWGDVVAIKSLSRTVFSTYVPYLCSLSPIMTMNGLYRETDFTSS